jgi:4-amino-4-deoxy-L-arabinose transferase-like glycosyltransferase
MTATLAPEHASSPDATSEFWESAPDRRDDRSGGGSRLRRIWRGKETDPAWARPALFLLLAVTAFLYLWDLGSSGWANSYYAAAVQAGTKSWKAMFFGSTDASNFITVDKTPLSLWPMEISARIFGLNSWSMLVPQALMGVATVGVLYAAVKRWFGAGAGLLAGAVCALTPVAALMFRFNNPDASLTLLMTLGAYAVTRALEKDSTKWVMAAGAFVGLAFLSKELQAFLVLPAFGLVYLIAGPPKFARRLWHCIVMGLSTMAAAGWWIAIVYAWPASSRPYLGGSQNNTFFDVLFGYNGFGRLSGNETGSVGGFGGNGGQWGPTGLTRLFNAAFGGEASWLLPAALIFLVGVLAWTLPRHRTDRARAGMVLWGGWLVVTGLAISLGKGIIHEYYTVALAPAIGAVVAIGAVFFWRKREHAGARAFLAAAVGASAIWSAILLDRASDWNPWLHDVVLFGGGIAALALLFPIVNKRVATFVAASALVLGLAAPAAWTLATVTTPHSGSIPTSGPSSAGGFGRGGPGGGFPGGGFPGGFAGGRINGGTTNGGTTNGGFPGGQARGGGAGGLLNAGKVSDTIAKFLQEHSDGYRWVAAAVGANTAAGYQLASGDAIMAIGGFNGSDPAPSLAQFKQYVADGKIHYFISGGGFGGPGGGQSGSGSSISSWVSSNFQSVTVGGTTFYDLTKPLS